MDKNQGYDVNIVTSARDLARVQPQKVRFAFSEKPEHVMPCDGLNSHTAGEIVDACIDAELLNLSPKNTWVRLID